MAPMTQKTILVSLCILGACVLGYFRILPSEAVAGVFGAVLGNMAPGVMKGSDQ